MQPPRRMLESEVTATATTFALNEPMAGPTLKLSAKMANFRANGPLPHECSPPGHRRETETGDRSLEIRKLPQRSPAPLCFGSNQFASITHANTPAPPSNDERATHGAAVGRPHRQDRPRRHVVP